MARPTPEQVINMYARQMGLDPRAVKVVSRREGGLQWGEVGDSGHAFGPFQMNDAGGVLTNRPGNHAAYANSVPGMLDAMRAMSKVARGLKGRAAISAIVRGYERPANPGKEIADAWAMYGSQGGIPSGGGSGAIKAAAGMGGGMPDLSAARRKAILGYAQGQVNAYLNDREAPSALGLVKQLSNINRRSTLNDVGAQVQGSPSPTFTGKGFGHQAELFYDPLGGYKFGKSIGAIGHHSDHVHFADTNMGEMIRAMQLAQKLGLHVSENPYVDPVDPVHVSNSYHYKTLGRYKGRKVGEAFDASGSPQQMKQLFTGLRR